MKNAKDEGEREEEGKGEELWLAVAMMEVSGELRELLFTVLYLCSSPSRLMSTK